MNPFVPELFIVYNGWSEYITTITAKCGQPYCPLYRPACESLQCVLREQIGGVIFVFASYTPELDPEVGVTSPNSCVCQLDAGYSLRLQLCGSVHRGQLPRT